MGENNPEGRKLKPCARSSLVRRHADLEADLWITSLWGGDREGLLHVWQVCTCSLCFAEVGGGGRGAVSGFLIISLAYVTDIPCLLLFHFAFCEMEIKNKNLSNKTKLNDQLVQGEERNTETSKRILQNILSMKVMVFWNTEVGW